MGVVRFVNPEAQDIPDDAFLPALRVDANAKCRAVVARYGALEQELLRRLALQQSADATRLYADAAGPRITTQASP